jgi:hypothetical protein
VFDLSQEQPKDSFRAESSIEVSDGTGMDYTQDYIYGGDQSEYTESEETADRTED